MKPGTPAGLGHPSRRPTAARCSPLGAVSALGWGEGTPPRPDAPKGLITRLMGSRRPPLKRPPKASEVRLGHSPDPGAETSPEGLQRGLAHGSGPHPSLASHAAMEPPVLTIAQLLELMDAVQRVPDRVRTLDPEYLLPQIWVAAASLRQMIQSDLATYKVMQAELDEHLTSVEHEPNSKCWRHRAEAIAAQQLLAEKLEQVEKVIAAVQQMINHDNDSGLN